MTKQHMVVLANDWHYLWMTCQI